jgi:translocation and assembly module TamB
MGDGQVSVQAALDALPMSTVDAVWDSGFSGRVSAEVNLEGSFEAPRGTASLSATGLRPRDAKDLPELKLTTTAEWQNGRLKAAGELGGDQVTAARFSADAPLQLGPDGTIVVPEDAPLSGNLSWNGNIRTLLLFVPLPQHRLSGAANIDIAVSGTPGAPTAEGQVALENGRYENLEQGTILKDLALTAEVTEQRVTLTKLSGSDGAGGKISGKGGLEIDPDRSFPFDVSVSLDKFHA